MIDPIKYIRKAIYDYLQPNKVFDAIADFSAEFPFITITRIIVLNRSEKPCNRFEADIQLDIYNDGKTRGGNLTTDEISDLVFAMIDDETFLVDNFKVFDFSLINTSTTAVNLNNRNLFRRTFNLKLQLNG